MIDYLNPSRVYANPPFCGVNCNELQQNCTTKSTKTAPQRENAESAETHCAWCGPEKIGWFSVQFWVRSCYGKRKWMSVTQDWKKNVRYCPMCGRKLEVEG